MVTKKDKLAKENYHLGDSRMSKEGMAKAKIIKEYLEKEAEKERNLQETNHKENVEKLKEKIGTMTRIHSKFEAKKKKQLFEEMMRDMHYRIGMKKALEIIEGRDE